MVTRQGMAKLVITVSPTFFFRTMPPQNRPRPGIVIIRTSATEVSIQAVSPVSIFGASSANAGTAAIIAVKNAGSPARNQLFDVMGGSSITWLRFFGGSERIGVGFAGADAHSIFDRVDEYFSVADLAGFGGRRDGANYFLNLVRCDRDLDLELRQEVHDIFGTAIDLGMPLLPAEALDLGNSQSVDADAGEGVTHLLQLERLDDGHDYLHVVLSPLARLGGGRGRRFVRASAREDGRVPAPAPAPRN